MDQDLRIISTTEELKIVSDPYRLQIIGVYRDYGKPLTVKGCADLLGEVPAKVHYHVKKLLSIDVLVLDHIEVINGINAKFYKLQKRGLKFQLEDTGDHPLEDDFKHIANLVISQLENFKIDFLNSSHKAMERKEKNPYEVGWLANYSLYLSEEEFDEIQTWIFKKIANYDKKGENKRKYLFISGLSPKDQEK